MSICGAPFRNGDTGETVTCTRQRHWRRGLHVHTSPGTRVEWYVDREDRPWGVQAEVDPPAPTAVDVTAPMTAVPAPRPSASDDTLELPVVASAQA